MPAEQTWPTSSRPLLDGETSASRRRRGRWSRSWRARRRRRSWPDSSSRCARRARRSTRSSASATRSSSTPLPLPVDPMALDIVGTGGDRFGTVNVSTMASVVAAASGVPGRQARQPGGELGVGLVRRARRARHRPDAPARARSPRCSARPASRSRSPRAFHPGFKHAGPVRAELGVPTVFNFLGPLCNPARPEASRRRRRAPRPRAADRRRVPDPRRDRARVPRRRRARRAHHHRSQPHVGGLAAATVHEHDLDPRDLGIPRASIDDLRRRRRRAQRRDRARACSRASAGPVRDIVLLNAAAGLVAFELAKDPAPVPARHPRPVPRQDGRRGGGDRQRRRRRASSSSGSPRPGPDADAASRCMRKGPADRRGPSVMRAAVAGSPVRHVVVDPVEGLRDGLLPQPHLSLALRGHPSCGSQRESSCQLARSSSRSAQKPTASPAA